MKVQIFSSLMLLVAATTVAQAVDVKLEYQRHPDGRGGGYRPHGYMHLMVQPEAPAGEWVLPELKQPVYGLATFADGARLLVFSMADESSEFYDRVFFDANANRDLTDDMVIEGEATITERGGNRDGRVTFPAIDTTVAINGTPLPFSFLVGASGHNLQKINVAAVTKENIRRYYNFNLQLNCSYSGVWTNAMETYHVTLADRDCNGSIADPFKLTEHHRYSRDVKEFHAQGDGLYVSEGRKNGHYDGEALPSWLLIKDTLYAVAVDQVAGRLSLTPFTEPTARLELPMVAQRVTLHSKGDRRSLVAIDPGTSVTLPPGDYRLVGYHATKKTAEGDEWVIHGSGTSLGAYVGAAVGRQAQMTFGEPYTPSASISSMASQPTQPLGRDVRLQFAVSGAGGESVSRVSRISGSGTAIAMAKRYSDRPKEPSYKVLSKEGEVVAQGNFEYG